MTAVKSRSMGWTGLEMSFLESVDISVWSWSVGAPSSQLDPLRVVECAKFEGKIQGDGRPEATTSEEVDRPDGQCS